MDATGEVHDPFGSEVFHRVVEHSAIGTCLLSPEGSIRWLNAAMSRLLGRSVAECQRLTWSDVTGPAESAELLGIAARGGSDCERRVGRWLRPDGQVVWGDLSVSCLLGSPTQVELLVLQVLDVTAEVTQRQDLAQSAERYRLLAENASDVVSRWDTAGVLQWISPAVNELFGWRPEDLIGKSAQEIIHPEDLSRVTRGTAAQGRGDPVAGRVRVRCADGRFRWISMTARPLFDEDGRRLGTVTGWREVDAEVAAEEALAASEEHYRLLAENATDVIVKTGARGAIAWVSPSSRVVLGWSACDLLGTALPDLIHPEDALGPCLGGRNVAAKGRCEIRVRTAAGAWLWMSDAWHKLPDTPELPAGMIHSLRDIQSERVAREALQFLAYHDPLTRLATRSVAGGRLQQLLHGNRRGAGPVAVLFVDIDNLKEINDTFGHAAGDEALRVTAQRLLHSSRTGDLVARFGGDEFLIVLTEVTSTEGVVAAAERIRADAAEPFFSDEHPIAVSVSVGVAFAEPGSDPAAALRLADAALYRAKRAGRDRVVVDGGSVPKQSTVTRTPADYNFSTGA